MKKLFFTLLTFVFIFSCEKDRGDENLINAVNQKEININKNKTNLDFIQNLDQIQDNLNKFLNSKKNTKSSELYYCSEESGNYTSLTYLTIGHYLSSTYNNDINSRDPDLQSLFNARFNNPNASGNNSVNVSLQFDVYGDDDGDAFLDATDSNRLYNEVICQLQQLSGNPGPRRNEYNIYFEIGYLACCDGPVCCYPFLSAIGVMYWD